MNQGRRRAIHTSPVPFLKFQFVCTTLVGAPRAIEKVARPDPNLFVIISTSVMLVPETSPVENVFAFTLQSALRPKALMLVGKGRTGNPGRGVIAGAQRHCGRGRRMVHSGVTRIVGPASLPFFRLTRNHFGSSACKEHFKRC